MNTLHVAKWNCFGVSRLLMERKWDSGRVVFVAVAVTGWEKNAESWKVVFEPLSLASVLRWALRHGTRMVFHGQSSLPYLVGALVARCFRGGGADFLYDMHDLHEKVTEGFRGLPRWVLLGCLERACVSVGRVRVITVSPGVAREVARRYRCHEPGLCFNIPPADTYRGQPSYTPRRGIVYFGRIEDYRLSEDRLKALARERLNIDVYGRYVPEYRSSFELLKQYEELGVVRLRGEYCPDNLRFLDAYEVALIDYGVSKSVNVRYCLPNKLFQALRHGLTVLVSPNLEDALAVFSSVPGAVMSLTTESTIQATIQRARSIRPPDYIERINRLLDKLHDQSRNTYLHPD